MNLTLIWVLLALGAFLSRWVGDFLIQKSARKVGNRETLLIVALSATIILFPFIYHDLHLILLPQNIFILLWVALIFFIMSLLNFEALKRWKISVVEPVFTIEVPVAIFLAFIFFNETLAWPQWILIVVLLAWLVLISFKPHHSSKNSWLEKWVLLAVFAALFEWASNFIVWYSSRINDPLLTIWFLSAVSTVVALIYLLRKHTLQSLKNEIFQNKKLLFWLWLTDNAWRIFFAFAVTLVPIAIATSLSEWYIALACLLWLIINREKLRKYQKIWLMLTLACAIALAWMTGG